MNYKHDDNVIDPRDQHLVTYSKKNKRFVVEDSDLCANGIEPMDHTYHFGGRTKVIFVWSEKYQVHVPYRLCKTVTDEGDVLAWIYRPYFGTITTSNQSLADQAARGTELHIIND